MEASKDLPVREMQVSNEHDCPFEVRNCANCQDWTEIKPECNIRYVTNVCRTKQHYQAMVQKSGLMGRDLAETFHAANVDKFNRPIYKYLQHEWDRKKWQYIHSEENGTGKSFTANAIANMLMAEQIQPLVIREVDMDREMKDAFGDKSGESEYKLMGKWKSVPVLIIQDIGKVASKSEWWPQQVYDLIDYRLINGKTTIMTSNFNVEDRSMFEKRYGENHGPAIYSRLNGVCDIWIMSGPDRRIA